MSYYTWVNLHYLDGEEIDLSDLFDELKTLLDEHGLHHDVSDSLRELFTKYETYFTFYGGCLTLELLLLWISKQCPNTEFGVQGRGEELRDIWVREFSGGEVTYAQGTFID